MTGVVLLLAVGLPWSPSPASDSVAVAIEIGVATENAVATETALAIETGVEDREQATLQEAGQRFSALWAGGEAVRIGEMMATGGIRLHLDRSSRSPLAPRQAVAALRDYFGGYHRSTVSIARISEVGGAPPRGFAELVWRTAAAGTWEELVITLYVGFVRENEEGGNTGWRVAEIRIIQGG